MIVILAFSYKENNTSLYEYTAFSNLSINL